MRDSNNYLRIIKITLYQIAAVSTIYKLNEYEKVKWNKFFLYSIFTYIFENSRITHLSRDTEFLYRSFSLVEKSNERCLKQMWFFSFTEKTYTPIYTQPTKLFSRFFQTLITLRVYIYIYIRWNCNTRCQNTPSRIWFHQWSMTIYERTIALSLLLLERDKCPIPVTEDLSLHEKLVTPHREEHNHFHLRDTSRDVSIYKREKYKNFASFPRLFNFNQNLASVRRLIK